MIGINLDEYKSTSYAFLVEDEDQFAIRNNGLMLDHKNILPKQVELEEHLKFCLFQFLIGNTDWSMIKRHNVDLIKTFNGAVNPFLIPYDFDYSGFVNTSYAVPDDKLKITSVRTRYYRGPCVAEKDLEPVFRLFMQKETEILELIQNTKYLSPAFQKNTIRYIEDFYKILRNPKQRKRKIIDACNERFL